MEGAEQGASAPHPMDFGVRFPVLSGPFWSLYNHQGWLVTQTRVCLYPSALTLLAGYPPSRICPGSHLFALCLSHWNCHRHLVGNTWNFRSPSRDQVSPLCSAVTPQLTGSSCHWCPAKTTQARNFLAAPGQQVACSDCRRQLASAPRREDFGQRLGSVTARWKSAHVYTCMYTHTHACMHARTHARTGQAGSPLTYPVKKSCSSAWEGDKD
jgi:hypothetical protein